MDKKMWAWIAAVVVVVIAAVAVGVGVYVFGGELEDTGQQVEVAVSARVEGVKAEDVGQTDEEKAAEYDEFMMWLEEEVAMVGGVALNAGVRKYVEDDLGVKLAKLEADPQVYGALGAALVAREKHGA